MPKNLSFKEFSDKINRENQCTKSVIDHANKLLKVGMTNFKVVEGKVYDKTEKEFDPTDPDMVDELVNHFWIEKDGKIIDLVQDKLPITPGQVGYIKQKEQDPKEFLKSIKYTFEEFVN